MRAPRDQGGTAGPTAPAPTARHWAEALARRYLEELGFTHLASNYRLRGGELDLVMQDGATVVVVEVKQRKDARHGHPAEALRRPQLTRLRRTAEHFTAVALGRPDAAVRLDLVTVVGGEDSHRLEHRPGVSWGRGADA
ncbi:MAG: YraN family protein [Trueperaceae bacterium]|nr:YraN family protein [Trueperaceae bacterium]